MPRSGTAARFRVDRLILGGALLAAVASGLASYRLQGPYGDHDAPDPRVRKEYDARTGQLTLVVFDANGNLLLDTWSHMSGGRIVRMEVDDDEDGTLDRRSFYGDGEVLARTEHLDPTGRVVRTEYFKDGAPARPVPRVSRKP
jgi:hypothetical protein